MGLDPRLAPWSTDDARLVCGLFERLHWSGVGSGPLGEEKDQRPGYPLLSSWLVNRDLRISGARHIYLAETFSRATLYACATPGGEATQALAKAIDDLAQFGRDGELRLDHAERLRRQLTTVGYIVDPSGELQAARAGRQGSADSKLAAIKLCKDMGWLARAKEDLQAIRLRLRNMETEHEPVVYVVGVSRSLLRGGSYSNMGIELVRPIPPRFLLAKATGVIKRSSEGDISDRPRFKEWQRLMGLWGQRLQAVNSQPKSTGPAQSDPSRVTQNNA